MTTKAITSLAFDGLSFSYDGGVPVFDRVSFSFPKAKAVWIRAPGGRGKSTLLRILAGLLTPQSGRYLINGETVNEMSFERFLGYRLAMGYGFDMGGLLNNRTLFENLTLPLVYHKILSPEDAHARVDETLRLFGMGQARDFRPFAVSGSQRKLTCVLRAFVHWPQVVLLDDPITGLKQDNLNDLIHFVEEGYASRGLKQIIFSGESPVLARRFQAEEVLISNDWFTAKAAVAAA